ncbi:MAG TPA: ABC transporter ATP-binding protein [Planctomycetota bacterium]|nr:ABC transporter ATP-binding protein [Planctomycetota bacterium]
MPNAPLIDVTGLCKRYADLLAVDRLDFQVAGGTVLGLVGPNGAGKTTSMRCMTGIIPATEGRIVIAGHDLETHAFEAKRHLAFVPDTPHLFDYLTVEEHLRFSGRVYGIADVEARMDRLLEEFELTERRRHLPGALSRGMKQKAAICMAFLHDPVAIFLDEPLTGLDPIGIRAMKDSIVARATKQGAAVVVSSHQLELIEEICDEIFVIQDGRKIIAGTIAQIRSELSGLPDEPTLEHIFFHLTAAKNRAAKGV